MYCLSVSYNITSQILFSQIISKHVKTPQANNKLYFYHIGVNFVFCTFICTAKNKKKTYFKIVCKRGHLSFLTKGYTCVRIHICIYILHVHQIHTMHTFMQHIPYMYTTFHGVLLDKYARKTEHSHSGNHVTFIL